MKKISLISIIISVLLCLLPSVVVEGETSEYSGYVAFGDSMTRGYGFAHDSDYSYRNVEGAYPYIVSKAIGTSVDGDDQYGNGIESSYYPCTYFGMTLYQTMDLLGFEDDYWLMHEAEDFNPLTGYKDTYQAMYKQYGGYYSVVPSKETNKYSKVKDIRSVVAENDLISIELGMSDVFLLPFQAEFKNISETFTGISEIDVSKKLQDVLTELLTEVERYYGYWKYTYENLLVGLKEINPEAIICVISAFNPFSNVRISDDIIFPIGDVLSPFVIRMNNDLKILANNNGCLYIDCYNADSYLSEEGYTLIGEPDSKNILSSIANVSLTSHLTADGHEYIARQLLRALPNEEVINPEEKYYINVDIARYTKKDAVTGVKVNYVPILNYSFEDNLLTVPYYNSQAKTLTVDAVEKINEDGDTKKIQITYYLTFENGKYVPYRIFQSLDVEKDTETVKKGISKFKDLIINIINNGDKQKEDKLDDEFNKIEELPLETQKPTENKEDNKPNVVEEIIKDNIKKQEEYKEKVEEFVQSEEGQKLIEETKQQTKEMIADYTKEYIEGTKKAKEDVKEILQEKDPLERSEKIKEITKENIEIIIEKTKEYSKKYSKNFNKDSQE